ncbi:sugar phosphate isomerase/epimerase [Halalkalicoccus sp. NIPERK01]|uniref:sugar phosphate isomerase/epimerase family protein n=1 Tax=Halalkalicoccus sp. NIPERK01 TaxID=3053469 RepID=UPI00256EE6D8|nr:sugar phosphate isomerase/epimerase [Halalkalicoccus sp. NIPERK01]MDL5363264.1 sugar phosphate isomerase/epimerase [Halalkalicoccus sp. NIPERK01]
MGVGYATLMYDPEEIVSEGLGDVAACRYDGVEIGLPKVNHIGPDRLKGLLEDYGIEIYCVMAGWLNDAGDVEEAVDGAETAAALGAEFLGILPPPRGVVNDETFGEWLEEIGAATGDAGVTPVVHHHAGAHVEGPDEIRRWLDDGPDELELLFDTAHYYAYGDVSEGIERFVDDIAYVHLKDIDPPSDFESHVENLTAGKVDYDSIVTYFGSFTDLGDGVLDFGEIDRTLERVGYDGHTTVEIDNQHSLPLVHAKRNISHLRDD